MINEQQIEKYKDILETEREKLSLGLESKEVAPNLGDNSDDLDTEADEAEEFENQLSVGDTMRERLNQIDEALKKIEDGTYGICEECGKEIGEKVLQVAPESVLCAECKKGHI
jgi:DnaK suppressor protein